MTNYVCGFMFSFDNERVALIRKEKPDWQKGRLNAVGGKIEEGEVPIDAICREFLEETGYETTEGQWRMFCGLKYKGGLIYFYMTHGNLDNLRTMEGEEIVIRRVADIPILETIPNLNWLVPLALDKDKVFAVIEDPS
jgi:8-oxo-dGTP diphosphatase